MLFIELRERLWVEERRMRVQRAQHARDRPVINCLVGLDRLGVILFHDVVHLGELAQVLLHVGVLVLRRLYTLSENHAQQSGRNENYDEGH